MSRIEIGALKQCTLGGEILAIAHQIYSKMHTRKIRLNSFRVRLDSIKQCGYQILTSEIRLNKKRPLFERSFAYVVPPGIEPGTQGFSVLCSTN